MSHELEVSMLWFGIICGGLTVAWLRWILRSKKQLIAEQSEEISSLECELRNLRDIHANRSTEAAKKIKELEKAHKDVSEIVRKQASAYANLKNENETLRDELRAREKMIDTLESQFVKANAALETVKGAVDHHFHNEDGS